jgi:hypothetical protein
VLHAPPRVDRLRQVPVAARLADAILVSLHRVGGEGDDADVARRRGYQMGTDPGPNQAVLRGFVTLSRMGTRLSEAAAERLANTVNEAEPARLIAAALALGPPKATP